MKFCLFTPLLTLLLSTQAFAWGDLGHRVVGEVASSRLTKSTQEKILALTGQSLAQLSTWADEVRSDSAYDYLKPQHFITIEKGETVGEHKHADEGDVVVGINNNILVLKDAKATRAQKTDALRLLVHFVGDIHQPLHVGYGPDRGGNTCQVQFMGKRTNLHSLIDSGVIEFWNLSFSEISRFIRESRSQLLGDDRAEISMLIKKPINDWAEESVALRDSLYVNGVNSKFTAPDGNNEKFFSDKPYCAALAKGTELDANLIPKLDYLYSYVLSATIKRQLLLAGYRLANLLNQTLAN